MVSIHECSIISQILDANPIIYEWGLQDRIRKITYTGALRKCVQSRRKGAERRL